MKIKDFIQQVYDWTDNNQARYTETCDTLKAGNPEQELGSRVAVCMFATPDVIRAAAAWGAKLLIVHEPTFYDHWDSRETFEAQTGFKRQILDMKKQLIEDLGMVVYRYHDHPHHREPDMIMEGELKYFGLTGHWIPGRYFASNIFVLDQSMPVRELTATVEKSLNIARIRICGCADADFMVRKIGLSFGTPGHLEEMLEECDIVLTGEICEWSQGEFVRDCNGFGLKKAILVMGHTCSERDGMRLLAELLPQQWPELEVKYFESGDSYQFV